MWVPANREFQIGPTQKETSTWASLKHSRALSAISCNPSYFLYVFISFLMHSLLAFSCCWRYLLRDLFYFLKLYERISLIIYIIVLTNKICQIENCNLFCLFFQKILSVRVELNYTKIFLILINTAKRFG